MSSSQPDALFEIRNLANQPADPISRHMDYQTACHAAHEIAISIRQPMAVHRISDGWLLTTIQPPPGRTIDFQGLGKVTAFETLAGNDLKRAQGHLPDEELPNPWSHPPLALHFEDGSQLYPLLDQQGSDGGQFDVDPPHLSTELRGLLELATIEHVQIEQGNPVVHVVSPLGKIRLSGHRNADGSRQPLILDHEDDSYVL